ncbi:MAG: hypothetical protein ACI9U2_005015 [Bradymonadia bacterium]|jgi:hypothetical protein
MWMLILLLAPPAPLGAPPPLNTAPPLDVTAYTQAPPGKVSLNLTENFILGDPMNGVLPRIQPHLPGIEVCLQQLGPALLLGAGASAIDLAIDATGKLSRLSVAHDATRICLRKVLNGIDFGIGRKRMGLIKLTVAEPSLPPIPSSATAVRWTAPGKHLGLSVTARRVKLANGRWRLTLEGDIEAQGASRGIGEASVRHNHSFLNASGRTLNGFSLQTSAGVKRCLKPGERVTHVTKSAHTIGPGELYSAQVFFLAGDCATGRGRIEVGVVQLDARGKGAPVLRAMPTWAYRLFKRHR